MSSSSEGKLGAFSTLSIGIGGMVGGGIFAVTGLTVDVTKGAAPVAFLLAGNGMRIFRELGWRYTGRRS